MTINKIRKGEIDINNHESFFSILIKGLLLKLNEDITIRNISVPHFIIHTGDDIMYLEVKGQDQSKNNTETINENYVYNTVPRCIVQPGGINILEDQLTNPYSFGNLQYESEDELFSLVGEFRRMPIKLSCDLKYYLDTYTDVLELSQQVITKLSFIKTFNIVYLGQTISCSYQIPTTLDNEYTMELDGTTTDSKLKTLQLSIEVETNMPIFNERTIMSNDKRISKVKSNLHIIKNKSEI